MTPDHVEARFLNILATVPPHVQASMNTLREVVDAAQLNQWERGANKTCRACGESLPLADFHRDRSARDGRVPRCKQCSRVRTHSPAVRRREAARRRRAKQARPLYDIWRGIIRRCCDANDPAFVWYGARGVDIDNAWAESYEAFELALLSGIGARPGPDFSVDRIDTNGDYAPGNVRWATMAQQQANRTNNRHITHRGVTKLSAHWAREFGLSPSTFAQRIERGWDVERALTTPPRPIRKPSLAAAS